MSSILENARGGHDARRRETWTEPANEEEATVTYDVSERVICISVIFEFWNIFLLGGVVVWD